MALEVHIPGQWIPPLPIVHEFHWKLIKGKVPAVVFVSPRHNSSKPHHFIKLGAHWWLAIWTYRSPQGMLCNACDVEGMATLP
jgi:hypothetical protein